MSIGSHPTLGMKAQWKGNEWGFYPAKLASSG